jgi:4-amino-4-deoxy-L-arabinose transferase-like glycosyltransferase
MHLRTTLNPTKLPSHTSTSHEQSAYRLLCVMIVLGLVIRLVVLYMSKNTGLMIVDEQHYHTLGLNLLHGHGLAWEPGALTSIRPPLYPFFLRLVWTVSGTESFWVIRIAQILLNLVNVFLVYRLGLLLFNHRIALFAAAGFCFYPSFVGFNVFLLTEVLFTLLLTLVALGFVVLVKTGKFSAAGGTGIALGLAALTRSILWPFPLVLCPLVFLSVRSRPWVRLQITLCLFLGYALVITPWALRNTRLQGVFTVVDTMGGLTLRMGNYEHTPLQRAWDPVTLQGETSIFQQLRQEHPDVSSWTEGRKEKWALRTALTYMLAHPLVTLQRAVIKFANFWGLERVIIAGWQQDFYQPPYWLAVLGTLAITASYILMMLCASLGLFLACPRDRRVHICFLLLMTFICGIHTVTFGHERYHLPLIPFLCLYAAAAVTRRSWLRLLEGWHTAVPSMAAWAVLLAIWGREVFVVEAERIQALLRALFI